MTQEKIALLMFIATGSMALFAFLSLITAICQAVFQGRIMAKQLKSQENLLNRQNDIQQKQLQLTILKEKQEIREDFRKLIITLRDKMEKIIYNCDKMSIDELRRETSSKYLPIMRMRDLFGQEFENDAMKIINNFENIVSWETNELSDLRLFERGIRHPELEKDIPADKLEQYLGRYNKNVDLFLEAGEFFADIVEKMNQNIDKTTKELQDHQYQPKWEINKVNWSERFCDWFKYFEQRTKNWFTKNLLKK